MPSSLPLSGNELYGGLFWSVYVVWLGSDILVLSRRKARRVAADIRDAGSLRLLRLTTALGILSCFSSAVWVPSTAFPHGRRELFFLGLAAMISGLALRWWAVRVLGRYFTVDVAIHAAQPVIEIGPYRLIRHPAYAGSLLTCIGIGLALGTWLGLLLLVCAVLTGLIIRIRVEEAALMSSLGEPYRAYMSRTSRLIPFTL